MSNGRDPESKGEYAFFRGEHHDQVYRAHVDQDVEGAIKLVHELYPEEAEELVKKRFQIMNVCYLSPPARPFPRSLAAFGCRH